MRFPIDVLNVKMVSKTQFAVSFKLWNIAGGQTYISFNSYVYVPLFISTIVNNLCARLLSFLETL